MKQLFKNIGLEYRDILVLAVAGVVIGAAVGVLDFDGHTEQFRKAFVGQSIFQRTGVDDGARTRITH